MPLLSILVPTLARRRDGLERTLMSIFLQTPVPDVEVIVIGDTTSGPLPLAEEVVKSFPNHIRYIEAPVGHSWGHPQRNVGMAAATGEWVCTMDDDDIYTKGALDTIAKAIRSQETLRPLLFDLVFQNGHRLPGAPQVVLGLIGSPCIVTPNLKGLLGEWGRRQEGDYDFINSTIHLWGGQFEYVPELICIVGPLIEQDWTRG